VAPQYRIVIKTAAGVKVADVTDFLSLGYTKQVDAPGLCQFVLDGNHAAISLLELDGQIEVYRRDVAHGISWYIDFYGLYRGTEQWRGTDKLERFKAFCPGQMSWLGRRNVLYYAGTANRSEFVNASAETVMKTLVTYNATSSATTGNSRLRNGAITGISVQADAAGGNTISWSCAYKNLLEQLQAIVNIAGGDFDLVKTGAQTWEFRFYSGQLGTDRSSTVTFALEYGNMDQPMYRYLRTTEKTVAVVGGQDQAANRAVVTRTGPAYSAANDIELFVDGRNDDTTAKLNARGDEALDRAMARNQFNYKVLQTPSTLYGLHYFLGDLVKATYKTVSVTQQVYAVSVSFDSSDAKEIIDVEMRDL
jgi:hypothetical protein